MSSNESAVVSAVAFDDDSGAAASAVSGVCFGVAFADHGVRSGDGYRRGPSLL